MRGKPSQPTPLSGLPKIIPHLSTDSICSKDLEREALSPHSLFRLAENHSPSFNRLDFVKDLEREALSPFPPFRLAENHSLSFNHLNFVKDLEREALSPHPAFRLAENHSASFNRLDFMKELEREALSAHSSFRLAENRSLSFNHLDFMKDLEREALSITSFPACQKSFCIFKPTRFVRRTLRGKPSHCSPFSGLPKIATHLSNLLPSKTC